MGFIYYAEFGAIFDALFELGADINMKNPLGRTPLMEAVLKRDWRLAGVLLYRGADPSIADNKGNSPQDSDQIQYMLAQIPTKTTTLD